MPRAKKEKKKVIYVDYDLVGCLVEKYYQYIGSHRQKDFIPKNGYPIRAWIFRNLEDAITEIPGYILRYDNDKKRRPKIQHTRSKTFLNRPYYFFVDLREYRITRIKDLRKILVQHHKVLRTIKKGSRCRNK